MSITKEFNGDKRELTFNGITFEEFKSNNPHVRFDAVLVPDSSMVPDAYFNTGITFTKVPAPEVEALDLVFMFFGSPAEVSSALTTDVKDYLGELRSFVRNQNMHFAHRMFGFSAPGYDGLAEAVVVRVFRDADFTCPEHPELLLGQPIGMYHCPYCAHMQLAGVGHTIDEELV